MQNQFLSTAQIPSTAGQQSHSPLHNTPFIYYMKGDNMAPTIKAGDYALVEPCNRFTSDGIYLIDINGIPSVKRLFKGILSTHLTIINDSPRYPNYEAEPNQIKVIGKVCEVLIRKAV